ncbi:MAG: hypothetical protein HYY40_13125 [Bacteroidetes bacterium]|nr:hypothetical protein [Bacteroidota bacterium]
MSLSVVALFSIAFFVILTIVIRADWKSNIALLAVLFSAGLSSYIAVKTFFGESFQEIFDGGYVFGTIPVRADALAGWFILLTNFTSLTGILYGRSYMKSYENQPGNLSLHFASYMINHFSMIGIFLIQNFLAFLCFWEIMTISSFLLVIFEHGKMATIKAGINFLVQSHIGVLFLTIGFIYISHHTGSYDFNAINEYSRSVGPSAGSLLFICFFIGFAFKAGFVPFHTWLTYAHPAAPAHISGVMSGVIIKLGIFGILRMLLLINMDYLAMGCIVLLISLLSGVYGVMLAIVQHNVKKLLAYHSIENIGIIGMGIGLGLIGLGLNNSYLTFAGFTGALLHSLNHSLFKSLLFFGAGTVYQKTHTMEIEHLGGLIKKMPQTAILFLIASLAICGLPPFNGFVSEFIIYSGLFNGINQEHILFSILMIGSVSGLTLIGGLAMLCFTKAFGIMFLGKERHLYHEPVHEAKNAILFPKYLIAIFIILIGLLPQFFVGIAVIPAGLFTAVKNLTGQPAEFFPLFQSISMSAFALILLSILLFGIRWLVASPNRLVSPTWGCGYTGPGAKLQYTANSFVRSYRKLVRPLLMMNKKEEKIKGVFPGPVGLQTNPYDRMEAVLIDFPIKYLKGFFNAFRFFQNGKVQFYILYGIIFIVLAIIISLIVETLN